MNHVGVSPTDGNGPTQGRRRDQAVGTEDVKVTAMNMYKYKEVLRFCKRSPELHNVRKIESSLNTCDSPNFGVTFSLTLPLGPFIREKISRGVHNTRKELFIRV